MSKQLEDLKNFKADMAKYKEPRLTHREQLTKAKDLVAHHQVASTPEGIDYFEKTFEKYNNSELGISESLSSLHNDINEWADTQIEACKNQPPYHR
ncbi:MAG: hypothetical protein ACJAZP_000265 [Psychromonas sp.]|jgi:hypothetical protein|uniref:hypothetical protein n=1 Tax=Psychromonas sp. TaxID=1884585 RepID=UPI0039E72A75